MELQKILKTKDKFTNDELDRINTALLTVLSSLDKTIDELLQDFSIKNQDLIDDINYYRKQRSAVSKMYHTIGEFIRNGGK